LNAGAPERRAAYAYTKLLVLLDQRIRYSAQTQPWTIAMTLVAQQAFADACLRPDAIKFIATCDEHGVAHLEENASIHVDVEGRLVLLELNEYSRTNRNLVRSIWFDKKVTLHVRSGRERQFEVVGKPYKALISGPRFEDHYRRLRAEDADAGLSTVWLIEPIEISDENPELRREREARGRLPLVHLDSIARN
jgi:hypothetical protein